MLASMRSQRASVSRAAGPQRTSSVTQAIKAPMQYLKHSLAGLAMFASAPMARAADLTLPSDINIPDIALSSDITALVADNPAVAGGAVVAVAAAVVAAVLSGGEPKPKAVATQVDQALEALTTDEKTVLVDIRSKADVKVEGTPDIRATKKKLLSLPYVVVSGEEVAPDAEFAAKFSALPGITPESIIILIDSTGEEAASAAATLFASEELSLQKVFYVKGGAASWQEQGAPWRAPSKGLDLSAFSLPSLSLPNIDSIDALAESYKANPSLASAVLSLAAIGGVATFIISEFEVLLEVVGVLAAGQFLLRYLLFADDREKTFNSIKTILNDKIGASEATDELKKLASSIVESSSAEEAAKNLQAATLQAAVEQAVAAPAAEPAAAAAEAGVPENVASARVWISAYKSRSAAAKAEQPAAVEAEAVKVAA